MKKDHSLLKNLVHSASQDKNGLWTASGNVSPTTRDNIKVFVRVRPSTEKEEEFDETVSVIGNNTLILKRGETSRHQMKFDRVFPKEATQEDVYDVIRESVVIPCLSGFNATIFAYGQTGAGKTFTILGDERSIANLSLNKGGKSLDAEKASLLMNRGLIPRIVEHILKHIEQTKAQMNYKLFCSYKEIYSEKIYDLLVRANDHDMALEIRQDKSGVYVKDLTTVQVTKAADIYELLECGAKNRSIRCTESNERSSRSHTIFQLLIEQEPRSMEGIRKVSKLNVVDLAGSERWTSMGHGFSDPDRIAEMTSINSSLATLGNCINALSQKGRNHIPYRDSKLTRLLQDSLGGNNKTVFISNISPSIIHHDETFSTLRFAERANRIHVNATINEVVDDKILIQRYEKEIDRLRSELKKKSEKVNEEILEENRRLMEDNQKLVNYLKGMGHLEKVKTRDHDTTEKISAFTTSMLERIEKDQRTREEELARYHNWIHSIPIIEEDGDYAIEMKDKLTLMQRTIQIKQEEIERTKRLSQRDFAILQNDINEKAEEIEHCNRQIELLEEQVEALQAKIDTVSGQSPQEVLKAREEFEGKELLELLAKYEERKDTLVKEQKSGLEAFTNRLSVVLEEHIIDEIIPRQTSKQPLSPKEIQEELLQILHGCCDALVSGILSRQSDFVSHTHLLLRRMHDVTISMSIRARKERYELLKRLKEVTRAVKHQIPTNSTEVQTDNNEYHRQMVTDLTWLASIQRSSFTSLTTLRNYTQRLQNHFSNAAHNAPENNDFAVYLKRLQDLLEQLTIDYKYIENQFTETTLSLEQLKNKYPDIADDTFQSDSNSGYEEEHSASESSFSDATNPQPFPSSNTGASTLQPIESIRQRLQQMRKLDLKSQESENSSVHSSMSQSTSSTAFYEDDVVIDPRDDANIIIGAIDNQSTMSPLSPNGGASSHSAEGPVTDPSDFFAHYNSPVRDARGVDSIPQSQDALHNISQTFSSSPTESLPQGSSSHLFQSAAPRRRQLTDNSAQEGWKELNFELVRNDSHANDINEPGKLPQRGIFSNYYEAQYSESDSQQKNTHPSLAPQEQPNFSSPSARNSANIRPDGSYLKSELLSETESLRRRLEELDLSLKRIGLQSEPIPNPHSREYSQ